MTNPFPANFETLEGARRLTGQVDFTDPANQPGATFDGGTITNPLNVNTPNVTPLSLRNSGDATPHGFDVFSSAAGAWEASIWSAGGGATLFLENDAANALGNDLIECQNSGGDVFRVLKDGAIVTGQVVEPADNSLVAGQCALWFDDTNGVGNTKLMLKGKSADGTVKTAAIVLA